MTVLIALISLSGVVVLSLREHQAVVQKLTAEAINNSLAIAATENLATIDALVATIVLPTATPIPSQTPIPTYTPRPTYTPFPRYTPSVLKKPQTTGPIQIGGLTGTYQVSYETGKECTLGVIHEQSYEPFDRIRFELDCILGEPSFNMGSADGIILTASNIAVYTYYDDFDIADAPCNLVFDFGRNTVEVTQIGMDYNCGFGHAVYVSGTYRLVSSDIPELKCESRENNPCK